jgi:hypothetical protein
MSPMVKMMNRSQSMRVARWSFLCGSACLTTLVIAAERPNFVSQIRDAAISVDGRYDDWYGSLAPFGESRVAIQFLNDGEFLYLRLTASDPAARVQIMRQGFTVWFDPAGGTKKRLGIRYPVVERGAPDDPGRGGGFGGYGGGGRRRGGEGREEGPPEEAGGPADRVDIIGPGKDEARSLTREHLAGIDVAIRMEQGELQYELRVPLAKSSEHPYAVEPSVGKPIGIGLETGKMQQRSDGQGRGGGMGGGGIGGRGGGGMGGRGGSGMGRGGGDRGFQPPKPLKAWGTVTLAKAR